MDNRTNSECAELGAEHGERPQIIHSYIDGDKALCEAYSKNALGYIVSLARNGNGNWDIRIVGEKHRNGGA